ncbi:phosphate/phosphite/phosphonate ABC transporter substrate-binding protein [Pseudacidovorax intermedius]|uniref:phosphate/phosphite/phosphonate ABC transporter substrate-binding protein n=1 Tax=Pseudacidovorax intermedius TaxID=433924 RepID=UPI0025CE5AC1|nr:phosphate/phosphite/phosphonate ABC transporter substrate-binding protein [Pseudacidovorax intermedius]
MKKLLALAAAAVSLTAVLALPSAAQTVADGSREHPLRVLLIPADGGTESGTKADYAPVFNAVSRATGLNFDLKVGQSYGAVVEGMCNQLADIAFFGPVSYVQAHKRGCAQLLAVGVEKGASVYYAGMFAKADAPIATIADVKGRRVAFGDVNSASSFTFQVAMLLDAGIDPARDLAVIRMTGSHASSLAALVQGQVDVASLSFDSYERAVKQGAVDPKTIKVVARSMAIPYPPLALNARLPEAMKVRLKEAFQTVNKAPGVTPEMIRGYGGARIDGYDTRFSEDEFNVAAEKLGLLTDDLKGRILAKAAER